jgi:hypothetical protein
LANFHFQVLHPTQHRIISLLEYARAQSFPDWFLFDLEDITVANAIQQVGNAVPPNLGYALGRELLYVLMKMHRDAGENDTRRIKNTASSSSKIVKAMKTLLHQEKYPGNALPKKSSPVKADSRAGGGRMAIKPLGHGKSVDSAIIIE